MTGRRLNSADEFQTSPNDRISSGAEILSFLAASKRQNNESHPRKGRPEGGLATWMPLQGTKCCRGDWWQVNIESDPAIPISALSQPRWRTAYHYSGKPSCCAGTPIAFNERSTAARSRNPLQR